MMVALNHPYTNNKMATPNWITLDMFQKALWNYFGHNDIEILTFKSSRAVADGENYTSDLFRTLIHFLDKKSNKKDNISVIVKCKNEDGGTKQEIAQALHIFNKEAEMFRKTLPAIYEILGQYYTHSSKCLYSCIEPHSILIFEDLTKLNFNNIPRHIGFNLEHCFLVIEKMAQLHGASVIMYKNDPSLVKHYNEGLYQENSEISRNWIRNGYKALSEACYRWPGYEKYGYKLNVLVDNDDEALKRGFKAMKRCLGGFHVLNHGDLWCNNMMFSYNLNGKLIDMRFIDFQMNIFTSPAIDLHYFIATSTNIDVKLYNIDIILDHYYAQLLATLAKLQYSLERVPSREQFKNDYNKRAFYGLMGATTVLPFVKATGRQDASFENVCKDDGIEGFRYHAYNNERYRKHMEYLLPYYDSFGILD